MRDYSTVAALKARLGIADSADDAILGACLAGASRHVEQYTDRQYYATTATRYYSADSWDTCFVDDLLSVTQIATDDGNRTYHTIWSASDYDLEPSNSTPYTAIMVTPVGVNSFPVGLRRGVRVNGSWGYSAKTPTAIEEATLILASRLYKRKDAPFGVAGTVEAGTISLPALDPDVRTLLEPYRRLRMV